MVLADGGVCCIDEFDKMRESCVRCVTNSFLPSSRRCLRAAVFPLLGSALASASRGCFCPFSLARPEKRTRPRRRARRRSTTQLYLARPNSSLMSLAAGRVRGRGLVGLMGLGIGGASQGPRGDPRGDGAADYLDRQGGHHDRAQLAHVGARSGQPRLRPVRVHYVTLHYSALRYIALQPRLRPVRRLFSLSPPFNVASAFDVPSTGHDHDTSQCDVGGGCARARHGAVLARSWRARSLSSLTDDRHNRSSCDRYDDTKSAADQIDLMSTILSRFDLIFVVRDIRDEVGPRYTHAS